MRLFFVVLVWLIVAGIVGRCYLFLWIVGCDLIVLLLVFGWYVDFDYSVLWFVAWLLVFCVYFVLLVFRLFVGLGVWAAWWCVVGAFNFAGGLVWLLIWLFAFNDLFGWLLVVCVCCLLCVSLSCRLWLVLVWFVLCLFGFDFVVLFGWLVDFLSVYYDCSVVYVLLDLDLFLLFLFGCLFVFWFALFRLGICWF